MWKENSHEAASYSMHDYGDNEEHAKLRNPSIAEGVYLFAIEAGPVILLALILWRVW